MIFQADIDGVPSCQLVLEGKKTQTWRRFKEHDRLKRQDGDDLGKVLAVMKCGHRHRYIGQVLSVQPGRGKRGIGKIRITDIIVREPWELEDYDIIAEGFEDTAGFMGVLKRLYGLASTAEAVYLPGYSLVFELVKGEKK